MMRQPVEAGGLDWTFLNSEGATMLEMLTR
jgi:hypothetical protein